MTYQEDVERYIGGALRYPLKDEEQLVEMIRLRFPDVSEVAARTIVTNFLNRVRELNKRSK